MSSTTKTRVRRALRTIVIIAIGMTVVFSLNGAARKPKKDKASWFNASRGMLMFPLASDTFPQTSDELAASLIEGWKRTPLLLPPDSQPVTAVGAPPVMAALTINLSNASIDPKRKTVSPARNAKVEGTMRVGRLELHGDAIRINQSFINLGMTADEARLDLRRDKAGKPQLALVEAKSGQMTFSATQRDIEDLMLAGAKQGAGRMGLSVQSLRLNFVAENDRTLQVKMRLGTKFTFVGAGLNFTARVAIDDDMNARLTDLSCSGDDVLGPLIINFIRPALKKVNNSQRPIMSFPGSEMRLHDVRFAVDDALHVKATFGRGERVAQMK